MEVWKERTQFWHRKSDSKQQQTLHGDGYSTVASRTSCAQLGGNSTQSPQTSKLSSGISANNDGILDDPGT